MKSIFMIACLLSGLAHAGESKRMTSHGFASSDFFNAFISAEHLKVQRQKALDSAQKEAWRDIHYFCSKYETSLKVDSVKQTEKCELDGAFNSMRAAWFCSVVLEGYCQ